MKIIVAGKGGVGKTFVAATLARLLARDGYKVLAIDSDSTPNLAHALGLPRDQILSITPLASNHDLISERTGARPGGGYGAIFSLNPKVDDLVDNYGLIGPDGVRLLVAGYVESSESGCMCPAIALIKALLRHIVFGRDEVVLVDTAAGAETLGRGLAQGFDLMFCVTEPTVRSIDVASKMVEIAKELNVKNIVLVLNKVPEDIDVENILTPTLKEILYHVIRYDENVAKADRLGKSVMDEFPDSPAVQDILKLKELAIEIVEKNRAGQNDG